MTCCACMDILVKIKPMPCVGKPVTCAKCGKTCHRCQVRENLTPVPSAGKCAYAKSRLVLIVLLIVYLRDYFGLLEQGARLLSLANAKPKQTVTLDNQSITAH